MPQFSLLFWNMARQQLALLPGLFFLGAYVGPAATASTTPVDEAGLSGFTPVGSAAACTP